MNTIGERLSYLIKNKEVSVLQFCKKYNFSYNSMNSIINNHRDIGINIISDLMEVFPNLNINWLIYGTGSVNYTISDNITQEHILDEPGEKYAEDSFENLILQYMDRPKVKKKLKKLVCDEENDEDNYTLKIKIGDKNSDLIERIEKMIKEDLASQKLPNTLKKS